ncbi:MAG: hypothetical protein OIF35_12815, partial [Cellvibrionaceae bacterium]|nr:hypothetical protein [Cellvibrionaceae bacterium]
RWAYTPLLMILLYGMLASMCFIQTFDFMTNPGRYLAYAIECTLYIVLSSYLLSSERIRAHFGQLPLGGR